MRERAARRSDQRRIRCARGDNQAATLHNETDECCEPLAQFDGATATFRDAHAQFRYAAQASGEPPDEFRYAAEQIRAPHARFRYAAEPIRAPHARFRYAALPFRDAHAQFRYAEARFQVKSGRLRADASNMVKIAPPASNAERQRQFRERNPGYYGRLHARRRAATAAALAELNAKALAVATVAKREPLMLPAPVEVFEIPGMNAIPAMMPVREVVAVAVTS